jgi:transcriptional regulator with XRE-family HTH domain
MKQRKTLLRHLRRSRELSLDQVALGTGLNVSTISRAERGMVQPTEEVLNKLAIYFKVPAADLLKEPLPMRAEVA